MEKEHDYSQLSGVVKDENCRPLIFVEIVLPEFDQKVVTARNGMFSFQIRAPEEKSVTLIARKNKKHVIKEVITENFSIDLTLDQSDVEIR